MALTQLSDVIIPEVYSDYQAVDTPEKTAFFQSGIVTSNELLNQKANSGGKTLDIPFWRDLDSGVEPNYSDDSETKATPQKVDAGEQLARIAYLNQGYKAADLAGEIAGSDPMQRVRNRFGSYWQKQWQRRLIASAVGLMNDNVAANSSDMVHDISREDGNNANAANLYARTAFVEAAFTMGDQFEGITGMAVHSMVYKTMVDNNDIEFEKDSETGIMIPRYADKLVVVDDGMPVIAGATNGFKYVTALFGQGAFGYGEGSAKMPVELERSASEGAGGGTETLWERKTWLLHPFGYKFTSGSVAGESANLAELESAANWERVVPRKSVPLAFLISNG